MTISTTRLSAIVLAAALTGASLPAAAQMQGGRAMPAAIGSQETVTLGALSLTGVFAFATMPNAPVAGGFLTVTNTGDEDDTLIAARSPVAGHMEVHEMRMQGDVMRMREIEGGLTIPAGETVTLQPGGFHIMFMDLGQRLNAGDTVPVTLTFRKAGEVTLDFPVIDRPPRGRTNG